MNVVSYEVSKSNNIKGQFGVNHQIKPRRFNGKLLVVNNLILDNYQFPVSIIEEVFFTLYGQAHGMGARE